MQFDCHDFQGLPKPEGFQVVWLPRDALIACVLLDVGNPVRASQLLAEPPRTPEAAKNS